jgi:hypothetical protein
MSDIRSCPDCDHASEGIDRRRFLKSTAAAAVAVTTTPLWLPAAETPAKREPESLVKTLYDALNEKQRKELCFDWDHIDPQRGLLRTRVANNWHITEPVINSDYFADDQHDLIRAIFEGIYNPDWHKRIDQQLADDAGGWGEHQNIAIFGKPGDGKFEFVMTGRHMTIRCDGNSTDHVVWGGPVFYGHAASDFNEPANHPGNVYWPQAVEANKLFGMLDGKQQKQALVKQLPREQDVGFRGPAGARPGLAVAEMSSDQKELCQKVLLMLLDPYRKSDQDEIVSCLKTQGGLDACSLAFYQDGNIGDDKTWDCWRLEGPAFVWYFRGSPHVHVWANVAADPSVKTNA